MQLLKCDIIYQFKKESQAIHELIAVLVAFSADFKRLIHHESEKRRHHTFVHIFITDIVMYEIRN